MKIFDVVALLVDLPDHNLQRGQVGTIIEEWATGVFEVEFSNTDGITYAMLAIPAEKLMPLHWQPAETKAS